MNTLKPANELTRELIEERKTREAHDAEAALADAIDQIEENRANGSVTLPTMPESVVGTLEDAGYMVTYPQAPSPVDIESHTILWATKEEDEVPLHERARNILKIAFKRVEALGVKAGLVFGGSLSEVRNPIADDFAFFPLEEK